MKTLIVSVSVTALMSMFGCSPSQDAAPPPVAEPAPTASAEDKISDMDFETGEAIEGSVNTDEEVEAPENP